MTSTSGILAKVFPKFDLRWKQFIAYLTPTPSPSGQVVSLIPIPLGTNISERIGRQVRIRGIYFTLSYGENLNTSPCRLRFMLLIDRSPNTTITVNDVLFINSGLTFTDGSFRFSRGRLTPIYQKFVSLGPAATNFFSSPSSVIYEEFIDLDLLVTYGPLSPFTPNSFDIVLAHGCDTNGGPNNPVMVFNYEVYYTDE